ncbi:MAG: hypothetical protein ACR2G7_11370 [Acidimicrobiales bacterium]
MRRTSKRRSTTPVIGLAVMAALLTGCGDGGTSASAPAGARVDLASPVFSDPTKITNPLFPISDLTQVVQLGVDEGQQLRVEITLLPERKTIEWGGQKIEAAVSQFVAFKDATVAEIAHDFFAQADDGAVWYLGEDVANYKDGVVDTHEGTWLAGKDGPAGMIMPAKPKVGDVYRPENIPKLVFEEVIVRSTKTVDGPRGRVPGAIAVQERPMDGSREDKVFAPGYGEFEAKVEDSELLTLALAVPVDAKGGEVPADLATLRAGAAEIFRSAPSRDWAGLSDTVAGMTTAWASHAGTGPPSLLAVQMSDALAVLSAAVRAQEPADVRQASVGVARAELDLSLQFQSPAEIDLARVEVWGRKLIADAGASDTAGVVGNMAIIDATWDRVDHAVTPSNRAALEAALVEVRGAAEAGNLPDAAARAEALRQVIVEVRPAS